MVWKRNIEKKWYRIILILLPIFIWFIPTLIVSSINYKYYKFWGVSEQLDKDFNHVINTLGRFKTDAWYPYSPITNESLVRAAKVSPKFAELSPALIESSKAWQPYIDSYMAQQSAWFYEKYYVEGAALGSHFIWMFRDVMAASGYYDKGIYPRDQLKALAEELENACENNSLDCMPLINIPTVTSLKQEHLSIIMKFFRENTLYILKLHSDITGFPMLDLRTWSSYENEFMYFDEFTYNPISSRLQGYLDDDLVIDNNLDIRFKIIQVKETALHKILKTYQLFTLPIAIILGLSWLIFVIYCAVRKSKIFSFDYFVVVLFLIGLFLMRVMLLSIFNATSNVIGRYYSASNYIFLYLLILIGGYALAKKIKSELTVKKTMRFERDNYGI